MSATVLIMAKAPEPGRVKTRLCPPLTYHEGATVAAAALTDTLTAVGGTPGVRRVLALSGDLESALGATMIRRALAGFHVIAQRGIGLAERIVNAHLDSGPGPVFQVGMDTPQLTPELIMDAVGDLVRRDGPDAVLGPAEDGGWWGLGLRRPDRAGPVGAVAMSTSSTGSDTLAALRADGLRVALLPVLRDVDTVADAEAVAAAAPATRFAALIGTLTGQGACHRACTEPVDVPSPTGSRSTSSGNATGTTRPGAR